LSISKTKTPVAAYEYELPEALIAQQPSARRDASRLMVLDGATTQHRRFCDLPALLRPDDVLVINETRVIPARLLGRRAPGGGEAELLLLHPANSLRYDPTARTWIALARPARRLRRGDRFAFGEAGEALVVEELAEGLRAIELRFTGSLQDFLARSGRLPLPPYIREDPPEVQERYQTVFARVAGSVAAPTASLHFTPELLADLERRGIEIVRVSLNVGLGTFRPVTAQAVEDHAMHAEAYAIAPAAAERLREARRRQRRIVAVGTTVVRALEGNIHSYGAIEAGEHTTDLFITEGYRFNVIGAMITNFHLPRSTLLMLVCAFGGRERVLDAYAQAIAQRYRFYSFGDAMLLT
jgi:S-adenosylmethionine:tRNA ribosyltransferase-isomerase